MGRKSKREVALEQDIALLEEIISEARAKDSFTAAVTAVSRLATLRVDQHRLTEVRKAHKAKDELQRIALLRALAEEEGSWVAAANYAKAEGQLRAALADAAARKAAAEMETLNLEELLDIIRNAIVDMPIDMVVEIARAAAARVGPVGAAPVGET